MLSRLHVAAAIVGGGAARRFGGQDKSRLVIDGQTIINRQVAALQPLVEEIVIIASQVERFAGLPWRVVPDAFPGAGVTGAIATALTATGAELVLTVACDLPFLTRDLLARLVSLASDAETDGAWIETSAGPEPLIACYRTTAAPMVQRAIAEGALKAGALKDRLRLRTIGAAELTSFGDPVRLLANINSPEDLSTIEGS